MAAELNTLTRELGTIERREPLAGGSINRAWRLTLKGGRVLFAKTHPNPPSDFFTAEAAGLETLAEANAIRVPRVLAVSQQGLVLEWLDGRPGGRHWQRMGEQLAALHGHSRRQFGFSRDNYCGLTPQPNPAMDDGFAFFAEARLLHQCRLARDRGRLDSGPVRRLEWLAGRLERWIPPQPASLIHGDLWAGNAHCGPAGEPVLIDPATHYGWAEAELAMTTLFGGFPAAFYDAYLAHGAVAPDWEERADLYNLYHRLNHLNLFGAAYHGGVVSVIRRYAPQ
ncbi:MAG: fructosamine kinase family protein [Oleiphilaceae bacterium]|nr:fructosamine kinase family protein [Oleiphilaceae bacterium]